MEILHTLEEIKHFDLLQDQVRELKILGTRYNNQELIDLSNKYKSIVQVELEKYNSLIGTECTCPDSDIIKTGSRRKGKIEGGFYFNTFSKSVRCTFKYVSGGHDTHSITTLTSI